VSPNLASLVGLDDSPLVNRFHPGAILSAFLLICLSGPAASARENLQPFVNALMRGHRGALIVSRPTTGELLAVWNPTEAFDRIYPPGSTAKLVTATAALEEGAISPHERDFCRRVPELLGEAYHCSHPPPDGPYDLASAIANSCNYFFSALSLRLTSTQLAHWFAVFGFGSPVDGLGQSVAGQVRVGGTAREKALAALGEQSIMVTPAQLLLAYSAVATRGPVFRLWQNRSGGKASPKATRRVRLQSGTFKLLNAALIECVQSGSGQAAGVPGVSVAGKTGTATALNGTRTTHAWFVGYAPADRPEIALVIFLQRGTGARDAAPLAGEILRHYFSRKDRVK
jgi:cell division protein FtsI/penicillin-binding protein 2